MIWIKLESLQTLRAAVGSADMQKPRYAELYIPSRIHFAYNFGQIIKLSANIHNLSANMTRIVCECPI